MKTLAIYLFIVFTCASLASCGGNALRWTPEYHTVKSGETLYSIAWKYDVDYRKLARWNGLGDGTLISPGQKIRLTGPTSASSTSPPTASNGGGGAGAAPVSARPAPKWLWPTDGKVALGFRESPKTQSGIRITGQAGQSVVAAADGQVVYAGSGLIGYGQLLIIKHNTSYLSAYGYNSVLLVKEGQQLTGGQKIARMGETSPERPALHFEIRRNGKPVDPLSYLPKK